MAVRTTFFICFRSKFFPQQAVIKPISGIGNPDFSADIEKNLITAEPLFVLPENFPEPPLKAVPRYRVAEIFPDNNTKPGLFRGPPVNNHTRQKDPLTVPEQAVDFIPLSYDLAFFKRLTFIFRRSPLVFYGLLPGGRREPCVRSSFSCARGNRVCFFSCAGWADTCVSSINLQFFIVFKTEREFNQVMPQKSSTAGTKYRFVPFLLLFSSAFSYI
jgi:hypothetical protein